MNDNSPPLSAEAELAELHLSAGVARRHADGMILTLQARVAEFAYASAQNALRGMQTPDRIG
jgi:hypothetical protein